MSKSDLTRRQREVFRKYRRILPKAVDITIETNIHPSTVYNVYAGMSRNTEVLKAIITLVGDMPAELRRTINELIKSEETPVKEQVP